MKFFFGRREIRQDILREFAGLFRTNKIKAHIFRGKFRSIFLKNIDSSIKIFRAKIALQTCHLKTLQFSQVSACAQKHGAHKRSRLEKAVAVSGVVSGFPKKIPGKGD